MRALYFVRHRPSLGAKSGLADDFSQNMFPITPPRNGNVGNGYRELLEAGFKVGEYSPMPKKSPSEIFTKNKNNFFRTWLFSTFEAKNVVLLFRNVVLNYPLYLL